LCLKTPSAVGDLHILPMQTKRIFTMLTPESAAIF
jgi:hypothetical protein